MPIVKGPSPYSGIFLPINDLCHTHAQSIFGDPSLVLANNAVHPGLSKIPAQVVLASRQDKSGLLQFQHKVYTHIFFPVQSNVRSIVRHVKTKYFKYTYMKTYQGNSSYVNTARASMVAACIVIM